MSDYTLKPVTLADHLAAETEGTLTPYQADPLTVAEQLLEDARFKKIMRMTAHRFGRLDAVQRRNYARWARNFAKVFAEKADLFERNSTRDPEVPAFLRARI